MPEGGGVQPEVPLPAESWRRLLLVMEKLAASSDLDEILGIVIDAMRDCLGADRASVFQYDASRQELFAARAHGVESTMRISVDRGIAGEAVRTRVIINVPDCQRDARFNREVDLRTGYVTRSMLSVPLVSFDGGVEGVAQVLNKRCGERDVVPFAALDEALARALASQAAVAIRRARLIEAERRKTKIEADLAIARDIQFAALPAELPRVKGYDIAARTTPADETGGDIFDVMEVGGRDGAAARVMFLVADAAGHGVGPALAVTKLQAMLRLASGLGVALDRSLESINQQLCDSLPIGRYVAGVVGVLDPARHAVEVLAAGMSSVMVLNPGKPIVRHHADALALAIDREWVCEGRVEHVLEPGGALVAVTDGFTEAMNPAGEMFGMDRVERSVAACIAACRSGRLDAGRVLDCLEADMAAFADGRPPADDRTAVVICRLAG